MSDLMIDWQPWPGWLAWPPGPLVAVHVDLQQVARDRLKAMFDAGLAHSEARRWFAAGEALRRALTLGTAHQLWEQAAQAAFSLGVMLAQAGRLPEAEVAYRRAVDLGETHGVWDQAAQAALNLGVTLAQAGRLPEAEAAYRRAVDLGEAHGVWNRAALAAVNLGAMLARAGRLTEAEVAFRWAVDLGETHGMWIRAAMAAVNLGLILAQAGRLPEAEAVFRRAIDLGAAHGVWDEATKAAFSLGVILAQAGHLPEAEAAYRRAMDLGEAHGVWDGAAQAASNLGGLLAHARRLPAAKAVLHRAEAAARRARFSALDTAWAAPLVIALIEPVSAQGHAVRAVPNLTHLESEAAAAPEAPSPADWAALCLERARARLHSAVYDTTVTRADFAAVQADLATAARWLTEANPGANANLRVAQILLDSLYDTNHDIPAAWRAATVKGTLEALTHAVAHEAEAEGARDLGDTDPLVEIAQAAAELALWVLWRTGQPEASPAIVRQVVELLAPSFAHDPAGQPTAIVALATLTLARLARLLRTDDSGLLAELPRWLGLADEGALTAAVQARADVAVTRLAADYHALFAADPRGMAHSDYRVRLDGVLRVHLEAHLAALAPAAGPARWVAVPPTDPHLAALLRNGACSDLVERGRLRRVDGALIPTSAAQVATSVPPGHGVLVWLTGMTLEGALVIRRPPSPEADPQVWLRVAARADEDDARADAHLAYLSWRRPFDAALEGAPSQPTAALTGASPSASGPVPDPSRPMAPVAALLAEALGGLAEALGAPPVPPLVLVADGPLLDVPWAAVGAAAGRPVTAQALSAASLAPAPPAAAPERLLVIVDPTVVDPGTVQRLLAPWVAAEAEIATWYTRPAGERPAGPDWEADEVPEPQALLVLAHGDRGPRGGYVELGADQGGRAARLDAHAVGAERVRLGPAAVDLRGCQAVVSLACLSGAIDPRYGAEGVGLLRALLGLPCLRAVVAPMGKVRLSPDAPGQLPAWQRVIAPALEAVRLGQPVAPALADALAALEADARIAPLGWAPFTCWRR